MSENKQKRREWDLYFLEMATLIAKKSKDNSLCVGCVIVGPDKEVRSTGYNGFCRGVDYKLDRMGRPDKYIWTEHAERNAVYNAARVGIPLKGCTAYVACVPKERGGIAPCADCTRAFIQSGVVEIVEYYAKPNSKNDKRPWVAGQLKSVSMLKEAGVRLRLVKP